MFNSKKIKELKEEINYLRKKIDGLTDRTLKLEGEYSVSLYDSNCYRFPEFLFRDYSTKIPVNKAINIIAEHLGVVFEEIKETPSKIILKSVKKGKK